MSRSVVQPCYSDEAHSGRCQGCLPSVLSDHCLCCWRCSPGWEHRRLDHRAESLAVAPADTAAHAVADASLPAPFEFCKSSQLVGGSTPHASWPYRTCPTRPSLRRCTDWLAVCPEEAGLFLN